ncbi:PREDICTED: NAD(P)H-quinone oxidoreductase subunit M, chloroplastic [Nicotiana attenuata]|uniref:NAD(P)H-quinone oxidoreductase subunit M, chloroplastic n=1 Tax=Nicotiana attenuata TaxID=49451 RepID=A0A1J6L9L3_NICAT|nr:PREDICTED: NAD(P)H-quinone oxidoreductase subunit M, chloroplastic [Nicotiana attenuata]OIT27729.1 nad(p)h-quinone oxidoreductase subunit m, chloroplastic [Nicotiana attenuata]
MAATSTHMASTHFSMLSYWTTMGNKQLKRRNFFSVSAQQAEVEELKVEKDEEKKEEEQAMKQPRPVEPQINVKSKNMSREYGGQWLSSATRHVRIYAAYIDPETFAFDQTQMDKLTLILDPTDEFVWTDDTCTKVYSYFQELVDHYEGAPLTEYTLRLIGSDIEHYIRKLLYTGKIQYNMNAKVLNFSMGKPRVGFNYNGQMEDVNQ